MRRVEIVFSALFAACWVLVFLDLFEVVHLAGTRDIGLYPVYGLAAALGSISGHAFVWRLRGLSPGARRRVLLIHLAGPPGALALLRAFAPAANQAAAPLVPVLAFLVFSVFFVVPLIMRLPD